MFITIPSILRKMAIQEEGHHDSIRKKHFPERISTYLNNNFKKPYILDIKKVRDKRGNVLYNVNISDENCVYRLRFNEEGLLILKETEPLLELDENDYEILD